MTNFRPRGQRGFRRRQPAGFTLVEMLVVITIIGVLAALITVVAMQAMDTAKQVAIQSEVAQLDAAFKEFKNKYGAYPPCDLSIGGTASGTVVPSNVNPALQSFILQAFPRYNIANLASDWTNLGIDRTYAHPDRAIVFWLSGMSPDVTQPFTGAGARVPFYAFDQTRLVLMTASPAAWAGPSTNTNYGYTTPYQIGAYAYAPKYGQSVPFAYIDSGHYGTLGTSPNIGAYTITDSSSATHGTAAAYVQDLQNAGTYNTSNTSGYQFCNPTTFQIISAGQDGQFGIPSQSSFSNGRLYPTGYGYDSSAADTDNGSNFCDKARLGDAIP